MQIKKCLDTNQDVSLALLQIQSTPLGTGQPNPPMLLFNRSIKGLLLQMLREPINVVRMMFNMGPMRSIRKKYSKNNYTQKPYFHRICSNCAMEDGRPWMQGVAEEAKAVTTRGSHTSSRVQKQADWLHGIQRTNALPQ